MALPKSRYFDTMKRSAISILGETMSDHEESDDATEFIESAKQYIPAKEKRSDQASIAAPSKTSEGVDPGSSTQYALYREGYMATTPTVKELPPGCYDITADQKAIYVVPALPPSGLLLELPEMRSEEVIKVVNNFWDSESDYKYGNEFVIGGAAYKAGLMIYGPPGSGKSCTIKLVSKKLIERGGTVFYASVAPATVTYWLTEFAKIERDRKSIVILEDIDSLIESYGESQYLEMLDSAKTIDNVLFIATTNYPERLDPRIYNRPGRFSHVMKIGLPKPETRRAFLKAVLKNYRDVEYIVENSSGFTIDHLSALINAVYREKKDLEKEIFRLRTLFTIPKINDRGIGIMANQEES
jgi:hypothetical protein